MKNSKKWQYAILPFLLIFSIASSSPAEERKWEDSAELTYVQTGGNTDVMTFSAKNGLKYTFSEAWSGAWNLGALYGKTDGVLNAERYFTDLRTDYKASEKLYYYALGGWLQDEFAGIDSRIYLGPGAGYKILTGEKHFLSTEAGLSYAQETYTDGTDGSFLEGRFLGLYEYVWNPKTKFTQSAEYLHNFDESDKYRINTVSALTTQLTDMFSLKVTYEVKYQNEPSPATLDQTDTLFSVALVVNF